MEWGHLLAFNLTLLAALASPGPALLVAMTTTLSGGRAAGIATGLGLGFVAALWTLAALLGLDALFRLFPWAYGGIKALGAAYLIWIAIRTWRGARAPLGAAAAGRQRAFFRGALVNLSNPKSVLFAAAVIVVIFPSDLTPGEKALVTLNHLVVECTVYTGLAMLLARRDIRAGYQALKPAFDRTAAAVLAGLGLRLLIPER